MGYSLRMNRSFRLLFPLCLLLLALPAVAGEATTKGPTSMDLTALDGTALPKDTTQGKVTLFVNVASKCGYTRQYEGLQALHESKKDDGLVIVGVPCNQFGGQEPGSAEEIATFCQRTYGVSFPMLAKQDVNGKNRSELYQSLVGSTAGGGKDVRWNFEKFLVGKDGEVLARFGSGTEPDSAELTAAIDAALK